VARGPLACYEILLLKWSEGLISRDRLKQCLLREDLSVAAGKGRCE
jgi:hypothetical protein